ncbi:MAG: hypothetical protein ACT4TC_24170 [Myxococcaceae bacterium]
MFRRRGALLASLSLSLAGTLVWAAPSTPFPAVDAVYPGYSWGDKPTLRLTGAGGSFLAVWSDGRGNTKQQEFTISPLLDGGQKDIYGSRIATDGAPLDARGLAIANGPQEEVYPASASDGTNAHLVVWEEVGATGQHSLNARRVMLDGTLTPVFTVVAPGTPPLRAAASFADGRYLIVWSEGTQLQARLYESNGTPVGAAPTSLGAAAVSAAPATSGLTGQGHLVAWERANGDLGLARVSSTGPTVSPIADVTAAAGAVRTPTVASSSGQWLVAFEAGPAANGDILATRVDSAGTVLDPGLLSLSAGAMREIRPSAAFDGTNYQVVWEDGRNLLGNGNWDVFRSRVGTDGTVRDPAGVAVVNEYAHQKIPAVACQGANCFQVWVDGRVNTLPVGGKTLVGNTSGAERGVSLSSRPQIHPSVSCRAGVCVASWSDFGDLMFTEATVRATRLGDGALQGTTGVLMSELLATSSSTNATSGSGHLVAFKDLSGGDLRGKILRNDGTLGPLLSLNGGDPNVGSQVATHGANLYFVVFSDRRAGSTGFNGLYFRRFLEDGSAASPSTSQLSTTPGWHDGPAVAFSNGTCLVSWTNDSGGFWHQLAARVLADGTVVDTTPLTLARSLRSRWSRKPSRCHC